jgi:hypothetical protein
MAAVVTKECKKCCLVKPDVEFSVSKTVGGIVYRHTECKTCRRRRPRGFEQRITPAEEKKLLEHEDDFAKMDGRTFHETVGLRADLLAFYRWVRGGKLAEFYAAKGKNAQKS